MYSPNDLKIYQYTNILIYEESEIIKKIKISNPHFL
jgi:hypothetical protein